MPGPVREREIRFYQQQDGSIPYSEWLESIKDRQHRARIVRKVDRMKKGLLGDHKGVGEGVQERRLHFGPGYRVYFAEEGETVVVLLCGGDKSSQSTDIERAKAYWRDYQQHQHYEERDQ